MIAELERKPSGAAVSGTPPVEPQSIDDAAVDRVRAAIAAVRNQRGRQKAMAAELGVTDGGLIHIFSRRRKPSYKMLVRLAGALGVSTDELVSWVEAA